MNSPEWTLLLELDVELNVEEAGELPNWDFSEFVDFLESSFTS